MPKLYINGILEKLDKLNISNPIGYMTNGSKNKKTKFCRNFDPMVWVFSSEVEDTPLQQFLLSSRYLFDFIFLGIVLIVKLHNCVEEISFNV